MFSKIWKAMNGKKTVGGAMVLLATVLVKWVSGDGTPDYVAVAEAVGVIIAGIGLGHKGLKTFACDGFAGAE